MDSASFEPTALHLERMFLQFGDDPVKPTEMGALHSVARPPGLRIEARSAAEARAADHVLELTAASSPAKEERPALSDVDSPAFTAAGCWRPTAPARENADPRPTSTRAARKRMTAKRKKGRKAKAAAARRAVKAVHTKPTESEADQLEVLAHIHDRFRVAAKSLLQAYAGHMAREKEEATNASKRAARRLRRSAERAAGRGDADGVAESDDDNEAESDDVRERLEKLEAMEHGEVDWDDDDVYSLGWGQSWSSVDHLA